MSKIYPQEIKFLILRDKWNLKLLLKSLEAGGIQPLVGLEGGQETEKFLGAVFFILYLGHHLF